MIAAAGFKVREVEDITIECGQALELDSVRREAIVMSFPEGMRKDFRDWSASRITARTTGSRPVSGSTASRAPRVMGTLPIC
jgi:hypothetical protein